MEKHMTKLLATLLAAIMFLPATVQAAPVNGWTDEAEQAYQTVTQLVIQRVTESKDYLAAATQEENAEAGTGGRGRGPAGYADGLGRRR